MDKKETILDGILSYLEFVLEQEKASQVELQYVENVGDMLDLLKNTYIKKMYAPTKEELEKEVATIKENSICKYSASFNKTLIQGTISIYYAYDGIDFSENCRLWDKKLHQELVGISSYIEGKKDGTDSYHDLIPFKTSTLVKAEDLLFKAIAQKVLKYRKAKELEDNPNN